MCWVSYMATPIVLKKPLKVYKLGAAIISGDFISLYRKFRYYKYKTTPTVKINPEFKRCYNFDEPWLCDTFYISEGYHSYLTKDVAKLKSRGYDDIGIFEIPAGSTIYINHIYEEVVSTNIKYLGLLER